MPHLLLAFHWKDGHHRFVLDLCSQLVEKGRPTAHLPWLFQGRKMLLVQSESEHEPALHPENLAKNGQQSTKLGGFEQCQIELSDLLCKL